MPYTLTSSPEPAVTSAKDPAPSLANSADVGAGPSLSWPGHQAPLTSRASSSPSPSRSCSAQPEPIVSGIHFWPKAPVSWRKVRPEAAAVSVKVTAAGDGASSARA